MGPTCYPIVAETPSGRLRYKTIAIGRFTYNIIGLIQNTITPRMLSATCKSRRTQDTLQFLILMPFHRSMELGSPEWTVL